MAGAVIGEIGGLGKDIITGVADVVMMRKTKKHKKRGTDSSFGRMEGADVDDKGQPLMENND